MRAILNKIERILDKIVSIYTSQLSIDDKQTAIIKYSLRLVVSTIIGYVLALAVAYTLNIFTNVLIIILTISILRAFSGGAHCSNMINCGLHGMIIMNTLGLVSKYINPNKEAIMVLTLITYLYSIWTINEYAPADTPGKPIESKVKIIKLRRLSFFIVCLWYIIFIGVYHVTGKIHTFIYISALAILWQSFSLTKTGYKFYSICNMILNKTFLMKEDYHG